MTALLAITAVLVTVAATQYVVSFRRRNPILALVAMTAMIAAAIPAVLYATLSD